MKYTYDTFWERLAPAYPVSKGTMRLPIVTDLQVLPEVSLSTVLEELKGILEKLIAEAGTKEAAVARATAAGEKAIVSCIDSTYSGVVRFDCVLNNRNEIKIIELNADYPDGLLLHDETYEVLSGEACDVHKTAFLSFFPAETQIHISHARNAGFLDAYYAEAQALAASGHHVTIGADAPDVLPTWHRRCVEASKIVAEDVTWSEAGHVQHLNSFALRTLGYKDLLTKISHPYALQTFAVNQNNKAELRTNRQQYVLKPVNGCEGHGIYFGHEHNDEEWLDILEKLPHGYIAQEYVQLPTRKVSIYDTGTVVEKELYFDLCPHFFIRDGIVVSSGHVLMRFSESPIVNVAKGGAIGYHALT